MIEKHIYVNNNLMQTDRKVVSGNYITLDNELYYCISNYDHMDPFFMSIVSNSDHWMYIWSNGALSAGRKNPDHALFPYYTDDKIKSSAEITGAKTIILIDDESKHILWEPFSDRFGGLYKRDRNCYKNICGNKLIFEEINHDLKLTFRYAWMNSEKYGFIKKSTLINNRKQPVNLVLLNGIQNILPSGVEQNFQNEYSTLVDAYKKSELDEDTKMGLFSLSSIPVDRAEPSEALKVTTVWQTGIKPDTYLISSKQLDEFRSGLGLKQENSVNALNGAYFIRAHIELAAHNSRFWYIAADIDKDAADVAALMNELKNDNTLGEKIDEDIQKGTENLVRIVAQTDGLQKTTDLLNCSRHFSNELFNVMRGGIIDDQYRIGRADFIRFVATANKKLFKKYYDFLQKLPDKIERPELKDQVNRLQDSGFERVFHEYLPLTFSRRHGDPSRPWNKFNIDIKDDRGRKILNYQGNWRDIFQNWEGLSLSFPEYLDSMITRFVNSSTVDGYNPYRLTRQGVDWEILDPSDPWSFIGYWGDHQIIYLLKLLEMTQKYYPGMLQELLLKEIFTFANVPYRIKSYEQILKDPFDTVEFDTEMNAEIEQRVLHEGADGKVLRNKNGDIYFTNLTEKLLIPVLTKLSNFIPEGGIWMNTQRPEWNDANNALVGNGISMVTLYYLRRHLAFCCDLFGSMENDFVTLSTDVNNFLNTISEILGQNKTLLQNRISDNDRKKITDLLGHAGSNYRQKIYLNGISSEKSKLSFNDLKSFFEIALNWIEHSVRANQREDKLFHAYNLIQKNNSKELTIRYLYEMLEGQVAVLSSGLLTATEAIEVLHALRRSQLYREDQFTYILYPDRRLPDFMAKNNIPSDIVEKSELLKKLLEQDNRDIITRDLNGVYHFNADFRNASMLKKALQGLKQENLIPLVKTEQNYILHIYEHIFDHQSFTGRSGTFFKYEGLGSIYWHMVSKLLLAVQETYYRALNAQTDPDRIRQLKEFYYEIKAGIGVKKSPELYGGFPTDPYSHTPAHAGVQQPGMTGQVKEDIISRFGELGVVVENGNISFHSGLIRKEEFLEKDELFKYHDIKGSTLTIKLRENSLAFTIAQVPFIYYLSDTEKINIIKYNDKNFEIQGLNLGKEFSHSVFNRSGEIKKIEVCFKEQSMH